MYKIIKLLIISVLIISSCSSNKCNPDCPEWEECVQGYCDFLGCTYTCRNILHKYSNDYSGIENIVYNNGDEKNINQMILIDRSGENLSSNMMNLNILLDIDEISEENHRKLHINFVTPESNMFYIPRQSIYGPVFNPLSNSVIYTYIYYEGTGDITDNKLTINYTCEFFQQSTTHIFTQD